MNANAQSMNVVYAVIFSVKLIEDHLISGVHQDAGQSAQGWCDFDHFVVTFAIYPSASQIFMS